LNERIRMVGIETLAKGWGTLTKAIFDYRRADGRWQRQMRECYDHGNGAAMLLFNPVTRKVVLTRQFRYPVMANGDPAWLIEACAGLLDGDDPLVAVTREALEETGYRPYGVEHLFDAYMSPGSLREKVSFFIGLYDDAAAQEAGGGLEHEGEEIEVLEMELATALALIRSGQIIDAKTIALLQWAALNHP
jgi:GDP-mannose pyrophosphatase NudK